MDKWQTIWSNHKVELGGIGDEDIFFALKQSSGYDLGKGMEFKAFTEEYERMKKLLKCDKKEYTIYEVGAGAGANLFLFQREGFDAAGCDYAKSLVDGGTKAGVKNLCVGQADDFPIEPQYDFVISGGMFGYLGTEEKAYTVLERMLLKAKKAVCVKRVLNKEKEQELVNKRKASEPDYEEKYKDLSKLYLTKSFFEKYSDAHNLEVYIEDTYMEGYWNNGYTYDVYLFKPELPIEN